MAVVVDTIVHLFEAPSEQRPHFGPADHHGLASLPPEDLFRLMDSAGVDKVVQVTSGTMGYDNRYSLEVAAAHPERVRVVCRFDPNAPAVAERLHRLVDEPYVVGVRLTVADETPLVNGSLDAFWQAADLQAVPVEVFANGHGGRLATALMQHPELRVMLDHVGVAAFAPAAGQRWEPDPLRRWAELFELVRFDNLSVRVSAIPEITAEEYPFPRAQRLLAELRDRFGSERLMWGSNYPPSGYSFPYQQSIGWIRDECSFLDAGEKDRILGANALRAFGIAEWS